MFSFILFTYFSSYGDRQFDFGVLRAVGHDQVGHGDGLLLAAAQVEALLVQHTAETVLAVNPARTRKLLGYYGFLAMFGRSRAGIRKRHKYCTSIKESVTSWTDVRKCKPIPKAYLAIKARL
jgi:hypothetical protein